MTFLHALIHVWAVILIGGIPAGPELLIIITVLLIPFLMSYWIYKDATKRGNNRAFLWAAGVFILTATTFVLGLVAFAGYFVFRD